MRCRRKWGRWTLLLVVVLLPTPNLHSFSGRSSRRKASHTNSLRPVTVPVQAWPSLWGSAPRVPSGSAQDAAPQSLALVSALNKIVGMPGICKWRGIGGGGVSGSILLQNAGAHGTCQVFFFFFLKENCNDK